MTGCYSLQPVRGTIPEPGTMIGLDITDVGRVALGGSMGPEISRIEGRLISRDSSRFEVGVSAVELLKGGEQVWHGEPVIVKREYVSSIYERRFSKGRTLVAGAVGAGVVAVLVSQSLRGVFSPADTPIPGDTIAAIRRPRP
ncbi:MAG TPA: hypothetical protein VIP11_18900 [Gemmatimonadaceae bacterium]